MRWFAQRRLLEPGIVLTADDRERAVEFRESLRDALSRTADRPSARDTESPGVLSSILFGVHLSPSGPELKASGSGVDAALASIMMIAIVAVADGTWHRLKVCTNDACRWAYWDASRNRSGKWCSMGICGNRTNVRAFRQRVRGDRISHWQD